jgi:hypothetical protein
MGVVFSDRGFSVSDSRPRLIAGLRCQLNAVIDLSTDSAVPPWLRLDELLSEDWTTANTNGRESSCQAFGRAVSEVSEALLVPSARRVGVNLVVYPKSLHASSILEIDQERRRCNKPDPVPVALQHAWPLRIICQVRRQRCKELTLRAQSGFGTKTFQNREPGNDYRPPAHFLDGRANQCDPSISLQSSGQQPRSKRAVFGSAQERKFKYAKDLVSASALGQG